MGDIIQIYGTDVRLPDPPPMEQTVNYGRPKKEQKWERQELPDFFETVEYNKTGDLILTPQQEEYAAAEVDRCKRGVWVWIGGKLRYFPPKYYFFLQYYMLEDGIFPEFREADRLYFLFLMHWERIDWCLGNARTKKRRQGASSQSCSNLLYEAIFYKNSNCGLISKTKDDSKDTFTQMVTAAYRQLPAFLKPKQVNKEDSVTELVFAHKSQTVKEGVARVVKQDEGHNSRINYRAPVLNAYDRGRMSRVLLDEGGKLPKETPASQLLSIISKTLVKGVKRVGWIDMPSTTNDLEKGGGAEFLKVWKMADQTKRRPTLNRLVRFFQPAYEAYEGYIDEYGDSVIDAPTEEQYEYLVSKWVRRDEETGEITSELSEEDIRLGARYYVQVKRREGLEGRELEEETRMNPCTEDEAFASDDKDCVFNAGNIRKRRKQLEDTPVFKRHGVFYRGMDGKAHYREFSKEEIKNDSFHWKLTQLPPAGKENLSEKVDGQTRPGRMRVGSIAVDSYSNSQGGRKYGSKASAWIGLKFDNLDPDNTGKAIGFLFGRPGEKDDLHEQVLLAAEYFGFKVWYEHTADDYYSYFKTRGKLGYLGRYPLRLIEPTKKKGEKGPERHYGTPLSPFSLTKQLDDGIHYFNHYCHLIDFEELLDNALPFEPDARTAYDAVVSFLILISCLMEVEQAPPPRKAPLVKTYPAPQRT
jgi:hypothetical protein